MAKDGRVEIASTAKEVTRAGSRVAPSALVVASPARRELEGFTQVRGWSVVWETDARKAEECR